MSVALVVGTIPTIIRYLVGNRTGLDTNIISKGYKTKRRHAANFCCANQKCKMIIGRSASSTISINQAILLVGVCSFTYSNWVVRKDKLHFCINLLIISHSGDDKQPSIVNHPPNDTPENRSNCATAFSSQHLSSYRQ